MNKKLKNALTITGAITVAAAAVYGLNVWDEKQDKKRFPQSGRLVEVRGKRMHIHTCGTGTNTIVMVTGNGTPTPSLDFKPLIDRLGRNYKIAVPEPFGYGYSDTTGEPRTVQNIVNEMREGLRRAGVFPPYILAGHAMGGIETLYWASHYPREVAGVIGIDTCLPAQAQNLAPAPQTKLAYRFMTFLSKITPARFLIKAGICDDKLGDFVGGQPEALPVVRSHASNKKTSAIYVNELFATSQNCVEVGGLNYPIGCPVLMLVSSESCDAMSADWLAEHERVAMHSSKGKCVVIEGGHYLHHTASEAIEQEILGFLPPDETHIANLRRYTGRK